MDRLVSMGGSFKSHGNCSPVAEYNYWADPDAAALVYETAALYGKKIEMTGLDVTRPVSYTHLYFCPFKHSCKISYASSFGVSTISEKRKEQIVPLLKEFKHLGVREKTAQIMLTELLQIPKEQIICVVDPTLLVNREMWLKQANPRIVLPKGCLLYTSRCV